MASPGHLQGAYGFSFRGFRGPLLNTFPSRWPQIEIRQRSAAAHWVAQSLKDGTAEFSVAGGGSVLVERDPPSGTYRIPASLGGDELAHPFLVPVAAVHAYWRGYETFHAGAFIADGRAWAVMANREGGKSSLLAELSAAGFGVVSDDLLVTDHDLVFAGPRSIDLRADAVTRFPGARDLGVVGQRPRWRLNLCEVTAEVPLAGWITLQWGTDLDAHTVDPNSRIRLLAESRSLRGRVKQPAGFLKLAALPMWTITRPQRWDGVEAVLEMIGNITR